MAGAGEVIVGLKFFGRQSGGEVALKDGFAVVYRFGREY